MKKQKTSKTDSSVTKYLEFRIKENKFKNGKSKFFPQGKFIMEEFSIDFSDWVDLVGDFDTLKEAKTALEDWQNANIVIEEKYHTIK